MQAATFLARPLGQRAARTRRRHARAPLGSAGSGGGTNLPKSLPGDQLPASCTTRQPPWPPSPCHLPLSAPGCSGWPLVASPCPLRGSPLGAGLRARVLGAGGGLRCARWGSPAPQVLQTGRNNLEIIFLKISGILPSADPCPPGAAAGRGWVLSPPPTATQDPRR